MSTSSVPAALARAERGATVVGVVSTALGAVLLLAPETTGRTLGVRPGRGFAVIGLADVVIGLGLLVGRPRWPWLLARAAANPPTAAWFVRAGRRDGSRPALVAAAALGGFTVGDVLTTRTLRDAGR